MKGRLVEKVEPALIVNGMALPIRVPAAFTNETVPVQDAFTAMMPAVKFAAKFVRFTCIVSVVANPIEGKLEECVITVACEASGDWASAAAAKQMAARTGVRSISRKLYRETRPLTTLASKPLGC